MRRLRWAARLPTCCVTLMAAFAAPGVAQTDDRDAKGVERPSLALRATPAVSFAPSRIHLVAELRGGADDYEEFYCASVEWDWGDGTKSEASYDCAPYEAGKSEIKRRYVTEHIYRRAGSYRVQFKLKRRDRVIVATSANVQVRPGFRGSPAP